MKPDNFDDLFRRKLEDISPEFREEDWAGFQAHFRQNVPFKFTRVGIGKIAASVMLGVVLAASAATHWYQYQHNQTLETEVATLKKQLASRQPATAGTDSPQTPLNEANSTINPYSYSSSTAAAATQTPTTAPEAGTQGRTNPTETRSGGAYKHENQGTDAVSEANNKAKNIASNTHQTATFGQRKDVVLDTPTEILVGTKTNRNEQKARGILKDAKAEKAYETSTKEVSAVSNATLGTWQHADFSTQNRPSGFVLATNTSPDLPSAAEGSTLPLLQEVSKVFQFKVSTINSRNTLNFKGVHWGFSEKIVAITPPKETEQSIERMVFQMPTFRFRAGIGTGVEQGGFNKNLWGEVRLDKHFAISTGIQWLNLNNGKFFDEDIFKEKKRRDFRDINAPKPPPSNPIFNIEEHTKIVQIPVYATYRLPLKNNFTLLASAGATYDASVKKSYIFSVRKNSYELETNETPSDSESSTRLNFSGASLSLGAEKTFKSIVVQAEGYVSPSLGYASYRNNDQKNAVGARVKVMYAFGK